MRILRALRRLWPVLLIFLVWQTWITVRHVEKLVMPAPTEVFSDLFTHPGIYLRELLSTLKVAVLGVLIGMGTGVLTSIASWYSPILTGLTTPPAVIVQSVPVVTMIPVITRVFGYNDQAVVAVAAIIVFFPTFVFFSSGLRSIPNEMRDVFSVLAAKRSTRLWRLALPAAIPSLLLALRISVTIAILGALVAEWLIAARGLGALLAFSSADFNVARVWGIAVLATALSVTSFLLASRLEEAGRERWT